MDGHSQFFNKVPIASGEAHWDVGNNAGVINPRAYTPAFAGSDDGSLLRKYSRKSEPWYDNYQDFREEIRVLAKDYAIVPEFRIHNIIEDLLRLDPSKVQTIYEIPGTGFFNTTSSFFRDYTNSERIAYAEQLSRKTRMTPKEIRLTVHAVKKFNPYKGFYPAQRTLDLAGQFRKSYFDKIEAQLQTYSDTFGLDIQNYGSDLNDYTAVARPVFAPLFGPGLLYNSIKSGIAVDYPVLEAGVSKPNYVTHYVPPSGSLMNHHNLLCFGNPSLSISSTTFKRYRQFIMGWWYVLG